MKRDSFSKKTQQSHISMDITKYVKQELIEMFLEVDKYTIMAETLMPL